MNKTVFAVACLVALPAWAQQAVPADPLLRWLTAQTVPAEQYRTPLVVDTAGVLAALARESDYNAHGNGVASVLIGPNGRLAIARRASNGTVIGAGVGSTSTSFFGLSASGMAPLTLSTNGAFNAPYFAMVRDARHAGLSVAAGDGRRVRIGLLSEGWRHVDVLPTWTPYTKRTLLSVEVEQTLGPALAVASVGVLRESGALLGTMQGVGGTPGSARTAFAALSLGYALTPRLSLVGMASAGRTRSYDQIDRIGVPNAAFTTTAYSAGLSGRQLFDPGDRFALTVTVPTRVSLGATSLSGVTLHREDGALSFTARNLNFAPTATERDWELSYSRPAGSNARLSGALMLRQHPGHDAGSPQELLIGVRYARRF